MSYVFLHGLGQTPAAWDRISLGNKEKICLDLTQAFDYPELYRSVERQLREVPTPLFLCGLSLGGVLALDYTLQNPDRVRSLVLIGAQYKMPKTLLTLQNAALRLTPASAFANSGLGKQEMIRMCNSMRDLDFSRELGKISCPVLMVCGQRDKANRRAAQELNARLFRSKQRIVEGAGHEVNVEAPEKLSEILQKFWG